MRPGKEDELVLTVAGGRGLREEEAKYLPMKRHRGQRMGARPSHLEAL